MKKKYLQVSKASLFVGFWIWIKNYISTIQYQTASNNVFILTMGHLLSLSSSCSCLQQIQQDEETLDQLVGFCRKYRSNDFLQDINHHGSKHVQVGGLESRRPCFACVYINAVYCLKANLTIVSNSDGKW